AATVQDELLVGNVFQSNVTYHYVQALSYADLPARVFASDPFSVNWEDPALTETSARVTEAVQKLLGTGTHAGWTFGKARPASGGVLLRFGHEGLPELTMLVSRAKAAQGYFRTVGSMGMRYLEATEDGPYPDKARVAALADALVPLITARGADWTALVAKSPEP
ncbi:MAG: hypothetical protein WCJ30_28255, partial [Deltaproteobacteria bacterium]